MNRKQRRLIKRQTLNYRAKELYSECGETPENVKTLSKGNSLASFDRQRRANLWSPTKGKYVGKMDLGNASQFLVTRKVAFKILKKQPFEHFII